MTSLRCGLLRGAELPPAVQLDVITRGAEVDLRFLACNGWLSDEAFTALLAHPGTGFNRYQLITENSPLSPAARAAVDATGDSALLAHADRCEQKASRWRRGDTLQATRDRVAGLPLAVVARHEIGSELRAVGELLRASIGDDLDAWQLALRLADTVHGAVGDLIAAVTGILAPAVCVDRALPAR